MTSVLSNGCVARRSVLSVSRPRVRAGSSSIGGSKRLGRGGWQGLPRYALPFVLVPVLYRRVISSIVPAQGHSLFKSLRLVLYIRFIPRSSLRHPTLYPALGYPRSAELLSPPSDN